MKIKYPTILFAMTAFTIFNCKKTSPEGTPKCVQDQVVAFRELPGRKMCDDASVTQFTFQGKTVFVFDSGSCIADNSSNVLNSQCESIGSLGGLAGITKINGEDFSKATYVKTIWKK